MGIPNNIVDAASAIKDGTLGVINTITIGDVIVSALTGLSVTYDKEVTRRPVQSGFEVTLAAVINPTDIVLDVVLANPSFAPEAAVGAALTGNISGFTETWRERIAQLKSYFNENTIVDATTHEDVYPSRLVSRIVPTFDPVENFDCWIGQVTLAPFDNLQADTTVSVDNAMTAGKQAVGGM
jgi:hypothetical protein